MRLETTFQGAGVMTGDLTPECAAVVGTVLDALSAPAGAEDDRTQEQRYHDALAEAMRRLVAANLLPERAGQPVKVWAHISLADLLRLDGDSALQEQWTAQVRAAWAAHRAAASETGGDGGAWLDGDAAEGSRATRRWPRSSPATSTWTRWRTWSGCAWNWTRGRAMGARDAAWAALEQAVIGKAVDLLSGPGGLASFLRRRQLGARLAGPSLPLDIGYTETIPAGHPQRGDAAGPALPVGRPVRPARRGVPGAPHQAQGQRRPHLGQGLRASVLVPSSGGRSTAGAGPWS